MRSLYSLPWVATAGYSLPERISNARLYDRPAWILWSRRNVENLVDEPGMLRVAAMRAAGLASGVAVPVVASAQVIGVLEFLSATPRPRAEDELDLLLHGAREVAALLARRSSRRQDAGDG
jgi:GAF domain-containing protein